MAGAEQDNKNDILQGKTNRHPPAATTDMPFVQETQPSNVNFFYDSDDEPPPEAYSEHLSWRSEPSKTHSDWTIEITISTPSLTPNNNNGTGGEDGIEIKKIRPSIVYHVHKNILSVGARKSQYFVRLFQNLERFAESQSKVSKIELDELSAKAFPTLLDYMYWPERELDIQTTTATALHSLSSYFEMRHLKWNARQFVMKDLSVTTCSVYLEHSLMLNNEKIKSAVGGFCAQHIQNITKESPILHIWDPIFWMAVMMLLPRHDSRHASALIARFCRIHMETLDAETFLELTDPQLLPEFQTLVCPALIRLENEIVGSSAQVCVREDVKPSALSSSSSPSASISSLQDRALTAISAARLRHPLSERSLAFYKKQGPEFMGELLRRSLKELQSAYWDNKGEGRNEK